MALFTKLPSWASILITVIAAIIVVGLVSWGTYTLVKPGPSELPEGGEAVEEGEELAEEEDEFKDWKTYRNEEYGFEVRYPEDWIVRQETPIVILQEEKWATKESALPLISIKIYSNNDKLSPEEWWLKSINQYGNKNELLTKTDRKILNINAGSSYYVSTSKEWESIPFTTVYIAHNNRIYKIGFAFGADLFSDTIHSKILSTFKFIE